MSTGDPRDFCSCACHTNPGVSHVVACCGGYSYLWPRDPNISWSVVFQEDRNPRKPPEMGQWIGVDLDGTLAEYHGFEGIHHVGKPIPLMVDRVKKWLSEGYEVKIFTARLSDPDYGTQIIEVIKRWCKEHIGQELPVTNVKDYGMIELWDDRAVEVIHNTGQLK